MELNEAAHKAIEGVFQGFFWFGLTLILCAAILMSYLKVQEDKDL